ncbi:MAG: methyltransferase protein [Segetibacter sp.]|nr:methyltransferase protein [Segetibacter sp.]
MKLSAAAQNPLEWLAIKTGIAPEPLAVSHFGFMASKFLLEAVDKGVFEAIGHKKLSLENIAATCNLNAKALESLLRVLASMGLIHYNNNLFYLHKKARKWILKDSPHSLYWLMLFDNNVCFDWMSDVGEFLQTGNGIQYHSTLNEKQWFYYQKAMEAVAKSVAKEIPKKIPALNNPAKMLDVGGSHGLYSDALCKKYPTLKSTVLDLPEAIEKAKHIAEENMVSERVTYQPGNIITEDLGTGEYDLILMASVAHHLTDEENVLVANKVAKALKPHGHYTIMEVLKKDTIKLNGDMLSALGDMFFSLSSTSGIWSLEQIQNWYRAAGLKISKKASFLFIPGYAAVTGTKQ